MYKLWPGQAQFMTILWSDLQVWPWPSKCLNKCFKCASSPWRKLPNYFGIHAYMYKLWPSQAQFMTILSFDLQVRPLPSTYLNKCFKLHFFSSSKTNSLETMHKINVKVMARKSSLYDHFMIWPSSVTSIFNLPQKLFQMALLLLKENNCAKLFWNQCINFMARTNPDGRMRACTTQTRTHTHNAHSPNWSCDNYVSLTACGLDKNVYERHTW